MARKVKTRQAASPVSELQTFEFDLRGFIVLRRFLKPRTVARINRLLDAIPSDIQAGPKFHFMRLDDIFLDLMADRRVLEICSRWVDPHFRFDHAWGVQHLPGEAETYENLHAGRFQNQKFFQYHWYQQRPLSLCLIFGFILEPQPRGKGGIVLVPGSHNLNMEIAEDRRLQSLISDQEMRDLPWIHQPELDSGDVLVMTEALIHGTQDWTSRKRRRNLYYKYSCSFMSWLPPDDEETIDLRSRARNEQERRLLEPPYVSKTSGNRLQWRPPTLVDPAPSRPERSGGRSR